MQDLHEEAEVIATNPTWDSGEFTLARWFFLEFNFTPRSRTPTKDCEFLRISSSKPTNFSVFHIEDFKREMIEGIRELVGEKQVGLWCERGS